MNSAHKMSPQNASNALDAEHAKIKILKKAKFFGSLFAVASFFAINVFAFVWQAFFAKIKNKNTDRAIEILALVASVAVLVCELIGAHFIVKKEKALHKKVCEAKSENLSQQLKDFKDEFIPADNLQKSASGIFITAASVALTAEVLVVTSLFYDFGFDKIHGKLPINAENALYLLSGLLVFSGLLLCLESAKDKKKCEEATREQSFINVCLMISVASLVARSIKGLEATNKIKGLEIKSGCVSFGFFIAAVAGLAEVIVFISQNYQDCASAKDSVVSVANCANTIQI